MARLARHLFIWQIEQAVLTMKTKVLFSMTFLLILFFVLSGCKTTPVESPIVTPSLSPLPTPTVLNPSMGYVKSIPVPLGVPVRTNEGLNITVLSVERDAVNTLLAMNPFNTIGDQEVILLRVRVEITQSFSPPAALHPLDFDMVDEQEVIYSYPLTVIVVEELALQLSEPNTLEGNLAFLVPHGHDNWILRYYPKDRGQLYDPIWFALK